MSVYVDTMKAAYGRMIMCHCWADTRQELFDMMTVIGVQHKWFQRPNSPDAPPGMDASFEHFDIAQTKRALAIKNGAIITDKYGPSEHVSRLKFLACIAVRDYDRAERHLEMYCTVGYLRLKFGKGHDE